MSHPYSIRIFLPGGDPAGLRTIEKSNWTGAGLVIPRTTYADARNRRELKRAGIYILIGPTEESGLPQGRSANGRVDWKDHKGRTLNELQETENTATI